jgi:hypothetical protein
MPVALAPTYRNISSNSRHNQSWEHKHLNGADAEYFTFVVFPTFESLGGWWTP